MSESPLRGMSDWERRQREAERQARRILSFDMVAHSLREGRSVGVVHPSEEAAADYLAGLLSRHPDLDTTNLDMVVI